MKGASRTERAPPAGESMNSSDFNPDTAIERDLLISRVVDGRATSSDWGSIETLGRQDESIWRDLAQAQRDHALLSGAVQSEVSAADSIAIPEREGASYRLASRIRSAGAWGGWAAAAAVGLAWMGGLPARTNDNFSNGNQAGMVPFSGNASDALQAYLDLGKKDGRVIEQLPSKVLVDEPKVAADGRGYEVIFIRQIVERERVPDLYHFSRDETGNLTAVPVHVRTVVRKTPM